VGISQIGEDETGCVVSRVRESIEENHALFIVEIPKTKNPKPPGFGANEAQALNGMI